MNCMPKNNHEDQTLFYETTNSTSTSDELSDDAENPQLTPRGKKQKDKREI